MANDIESGPELTATQLDAQRARNLLDRALGLAERNDLAGAIVVCRQSLALAPLSPQGWSMLGLLSERDDDLNGAIEAYEKTLQLSPSSTLERESLQRLRLKRGAAPRPAPKFNFDAISSDVPQVPSSPVSQPAIPAPLRTDSYDIEKRPWLWNTFYFRSLPVLIAAVVCLSVITIAQRVAANREPQTVQSLPETPAVSTTPSDVPAQPTTPVVTPDSLVPPTAPVVQPNPAASTPTQPTADAASAPAPVIAPARKPRAAAKPKPKPRPRAAAPSEMPVLPPPRITLPKRSAPAVPNALTNDNPSENQPTIGGGPVDVGNSQDSKYIPINPPQFPNASRQQR